ncbi:MAG: hypothetical protein Kow00129_09180 [Thermoleophilia bacterium]
MIRVTLRILAVLLSLLWGFFVAFNVVFSDVFGLLDRIQAGLFVFVAYALLGVGFGLAEPRTGGGWIRWLTPAGVLAVLPMLFDQWRLTLYGLWIIGALAAGSWAGARLGSGISRLVWRRLSHP